MKKPAVNPGSGEALRASAARSLVPVLTGRGSLAGLDVRQVAPRDRSLLRALCYGVCRTLPRLEALAAALLRTPFKARDADVQALLLLGIYQLLYLRVPAHAAVGETAGAARALNKPWATRVLNGCLRRLQREADTLQERVDQEPSVALMHPPWLLDALRQAWPQDWQDIARANNLPGPMTLRVNARLNTRNAYLEILENQGIKARPCAYAPQGLTLESPCEVEALPGFNEGLVSVQDEAAQLAPELLAPTLADRPGARVLDACSAPGGKTAHLLEAFDLELTALDNDPQRLTRVEQTLDRLDLTATLKTADASTLDWWDGQAFDAILLDAPCSGSGVIRRHPDIKRLRRPNDIEDLAGRQGAILDALWQTLAPGGALLYATCSVLPRENADQIRDFLDCTSDAREITPENLPWGRRTHPGRQLLPQPDGHDGFYYALIAKASA
ncbi:16S rRNA (cytosine(967)-C(5))-methyltransferase RsmB [Pistricoccus aurantiacus]|uniref:16S rRNA (cytosine(967)-C(5))-methyltransferase n=1 Tax=Pistricoccus aurantiacus TaxID=1883414 RepID=A0A5B8SRU1_9GAMM|nr:16S rRNA (cytosine(967)-C(5))-methyltransferase RsmB [Pistricoccus aurantiacus]QEA37813.1 16S rRNA (cytosine(967)-C(5))-methyltransferase RsmB [Pistricoccus aurantiacus]